MASAKAKGKEGGGAQQRAKVDLTQALTVLRCAFRKEYVVTFIQRESVLNLRKGDVSSEGTL